MTFALEFIPFLGGAVMVALLTLSAISVYADLGPALLVPAVYLVISGIQNNLLPFWLTQYPAHPLAALPVVAAAKEVRGYAQRGDEMALKIFEQQAMAIGRMFTIAANFTDPDGYFIGGGVVEAEPHFRDWFLDTVQRHTALRVEQREVTEFLVVSDLDMAGARGSAMAALNAIRP